MLNASEFTRIGFVLQGYYFDSLGNLRFGCQKTDNPQMFLMIQKEVDMKATRFVAVPLLALCVSLAWAQEQKMPAQTQAGADVPGGVKGSFLKQSKFVEGQMISLLEAVPQKKMSWRPAKGVRSLAESFMHAALGNYISSSKITGTMAEGVDPGKLEKSQTNKKKIAEALKKSFEVVNQAVMNCPEMEFDMKVDFFGMEMNKMDMIMLGATHQHELLGQQIAYARTNGVTPPWTAEMQKKMKQQAKKGG